ncbi:MAG: sensor domain-containing protein [Baekduia sp.]
MTGVLRQAGRDLLYLVIGGVTATLAMVTWTTGLGLVFGLAILIVGIPVVIVAGTAFRWVAELDRQNARLVLGGPIGRSYRDPAEPGLWPLLKTIVTDPQTGRDTAWLVVHSVLGLTFAIIAVTLVATTLGIATIPAWAWSLPQDAIDWGPWQPDTTGRQLTRGALRDPARTDHPRRGPRHGRGRGGHWRGGCSPRARPSRRLTSRRRAAAGGGRGAPPSVRRRRRAQRPCRRYGAHRCHVDGDLAARWARGLLAGLGRAVARAHRGVAPRRDPVRPFTRAGRAAPYGR